MRHFHLTRNSYHCPIINIDKLWSLVPAEQRKGLSESSTEVPVIDTLAAGYGKVLAKGRLPKLPCIVKARWVSELAEKKIKEAGGVVKVCSNIFRLMAWCSAESIQLCSHGHPSPLIRSLSHKKGGNSRSAFFPSACTTFTHATCLPRYASPVCP